MEYEFLFVVDGVGVDDDVAVGIIFDEFDGLLTRHRGKHLLDVSEAGDSAIDAAHRLVVRLHQELPSLRLLRLDPDLVGASDIADRTGRSRQNILQWVNGERRHDARAFPDPEGTVGRSLVWRWAEVNAWLAGIGESVGDAGATREDALHIDFMLPRWQQVLDDGLPIVRFVDAVPEDERSGDRAAVAQLLEGTLSAPGVLEMISAFPRAERQRLTVICAVLPDRLDEVAARISSDESAVILAYQGRENELHLTPVTAREVPGARPVSALGLGPDATVGDLLLVITNREVAPTTPVTVAV
ncbi:helix-turn-helix transcriptional regulator [Streptomyces sp. NPDC015032]|uniref:helix-turn-helix transcriptional regulator n=1 Tax=Streptomyces sp. NPDC015032 TaxID=3364937 RepID=UPI00370296B6